jgi:exonuclease VII small subunit
MNPLKKLRFSKQGNPAASGQAASTPPSSSSPKPKTLADLEKEIEAEVAAEAQRLNTEQRKLNPPLRKISRLPRYALTLSLLVGVPIGFLWLINLPYPPIRGPIVRSAPLLLLPSYIRFDNQYKAAINQVEQAKQLIDQSTSLADLSRGEEKLEQANKNLNALPLWIESEWRDVAGANSWYVFAYTPTGFNIARSEVGRLQAKLFQEKNAETALLEAEKRVAAAKQLYATAQTLLAQQTAIGQWENAIGQLAQIPPETLAGRLAQQKLEAAQSEIVAIVGQSSTSESQGEIGAAAQFATRAAQASQNPPHSVKEWQRVESLWQQAIDRLSTVSREDSAGYQQAQQKLAEYRDNLEQIRIRRQQEDDSVEALERAQTLTDALVERTPPDKQAIAVSLQRIIRELRKVEKGTTAYQEAQTLLQDAQRKLNEISPKSNP